MDQPPQFRSDDPALAAEVMRAHPFASLISNDDTGLLEKPIGAHLAGNENERRPAQSMQRPGMGGE